MIGIDFMYYAAKEWKSKSTHASTHQQLYRVGGILGDNYTKCKLGWQYL